MTQGEMFDTTGAIHPGMAAACSAEAREKVDAARLRRLTEQEMLLFPDGAIADEIVDRLNMQGVRNRAGDPLDVLSLRPRFSELKSAQFGCVLVETGRRRANAKGNSCAVLVHRRFQEGI